MKASPHLSTAFSSLCLVVLFTGILSACGGGGSSGGGGSDVTGTYNGTATGKISVPGTSVPPEPINGTIQIVLNKDGTAVSDPGTSFSGSGTWSGNQVNISVPASAFNSPGLTCTGTVSITGTISGNVITGTIGGMPVCSGVRFTFTLTFNVTKTSSATLARSRGAPVVEVISNTLKDYLDREEATGQ